MKLLPGKRAAFLPLLVITTLVGGVVAVSEFVAKCSTLQSKNLADDLLACASACNVKPEDAQCYDSRNRGLYCVCTKPEVGGGVVTGDDGRTATSECGLTTPEDGLSCDACSITNNDDDPQEKLEYYACNVQITPKNGKPNDTRFTVKCTCKVTTSSMAEQNKGRGRGKLPPILAQLLKALQQVRNRFSRGRQ